MRNKIARYIAHAGALCAVVFLTSSCAALEAVRFAQKVTKPPDTSSSGGGRLERESETSSEIKQREERVRSDLRIRKWKAEAENNPATGTSSAGVDQVPAPGLAATEGDPAIDNCNTTNVYCNAQSTEKKPCPPCVEDHGLECLDNGNAKDPLTGLEFDPGDDCEEWEKFLEK